ncbi:hypothetical protein Turpa_3717 [Turneriella parva DSM 21527]|uniref:Uncharacterized protein n=1 Tax=Turneriella parva (strain ATCC BAA-1111 / DSM 21527 / NCTC 11395 / H) TaxID=869212 RepID=I4BAP4_TURPD|nr:hypothetical protein Turpa_3717 [Turneriella parva DSM 21527]
MRYLWGVDEQDVLYSDAAMVGIFAEERMIRMITGFAAAMDGIYAAKALTLLMACTEFCAFAMIQYPRFR